MKSWTVRSSDLRELSGTHFLATERASASASWTPFLMVSVRTVPCLRGGKEGEKQE